SSRIVAENLFVSFLTVAGASAINTLVTLGFYRMLKFDLPPLAGINSMMAATAMGVLANLAVSVILYMLLDRLFKSSRRQRSRRSEARRRPGRRSGRLGRHSKSDSDFSEVIQGRDAPLDRRRQRGGRLRARLPWTPSTSSVKPETASISCASSCSASSSRWESASG